MKVDLTEKEIEMIIIALDERLHWYYEYDRWLEIDRCDVLKYKLNEARSGKKRRKKT